MASVENWGRGIPVEKVNAIVEPLVCVADDIAEAKGTGLGIGLYGILIVASAQAFSDSIASIPQIAALMHLD